MRQLLKIPKGRGCSSKKRVAVDTAAMPDFSLFVQSTSHNRVLLPNTKVLYRVDPVGETPPPGEDEGGAAATAATAPVAGRRGRGKRGGGGGVARPTTSTVKATSEPNEAAINDEEEAEKVEPKRRKTSASPGDQGCLLLGGRCRGNDMFPNS